MKWAYATICFTCITAKMQAEQADILGIRPMRELGFWETHWQWAAPALVIAIMLGAWCVYLFLRKKPKPAPTPYEQARIELTEAERRAADTDDKTYSASVSNALRTYLEGAFGLRAPEQTTDEFLESAQSDKRIPEDALHALENFLKLCDLAKFARHAFGQNERNELLKTARDFIEKAHRERMHVVKEATGQ